MSKILEKVKEGTPLADNNLIDCHCHIGNWRGYHIPKNNAEGIIESMDSLGIKKACISSFLSIGSDDDLGNKIIIDTVKTYPERLLGYITVNPHYSQSSKDILDEYIGNEGIVGIKIHPDFHKCAPDDSRYEIAYETANNKKCLLLSHTWGMNDILAIGRMAERYPEARIIMGHAGAEIRAMEEAFKVVKKHENVYIDTALSFTYEGNIEWFVKNVGSKKILFGSDMPNYDPRPTFGRIAMADISEEDKLDILGLNMMRILEY